MAVDKEQLWEDFFKAKGLEGKSDEDKKTLKEEMFYDFHSWLEDLSKTPEQDASGNPVKDAAGNDVMKYTPDVKTALIAGTTGMINVTYNADIETPTERYERGLEEKKEIVDRFAEKEGYDDKTASPEQQDEFIKKYEDFEASAKESYIEKKAKEDGKEVSDYSDVDKDALILAGYDDYIKKNFVKEYNKATTFNIIEEELTPPTPPLTNTPEGWAVTFDKEMKAQAAKATKPYTATVDGNGVKGKYGESEFHQKAKNSLSVETGVKTADLGAMLEANKKIGNHTVNFEKLNSPETKAAMIIACLNTDMKTRNAPDFDSLPEAVRNTFKDEYKKAKEDQAKRQAKKAKIAELKAKSATLRAGGGKIKLTEDDLKAMGFSKEQIKDRLALQEAKEKAPNRARRDEIAAGTGAKETKDEKDSMKVVNKFIKERKAERTRS